MRLIFALMAAFKAAHKPHTLKKLRRKKLCQHVSIFRFKNLNLGGNKDRDE
jgi:hypothetical protein